MRAVIFRAIARLFLCSGPWLAGFSGSRAFARLSIGSECGIKLGLGVSLFTAAFVTATTRATLIASCACALIACALIACACFAFVFGVVSCFVCHVAQAT